MDGQRRGGVLDMPVLADFLEERGMRLQEIASISCCASRARAPWPARSSRRAKRSKRWARKKSPKARCAWLRLQQPPSAARNLSQASDMLAAKGVDELATAAAAGEVAMAARPVWPRSPQAPRRWRR